MPAVDLSEFEALGRREQRQPCKVGLVLKELKAGERAKVDAAIRSDSEVIRRGVGRWLKERNVTLPTASIGSHRKGTCSCG